MGLLDDPRWPALAEDLYCKLCTGLEMFGRHEKRPLNLLSASPLSLSCPKGSMDQ
jgi:hypothetical protein